MGIWLAVFIAAPARLFTKLNVPLTNDPAISKIAQPSKKQQVTIITLKSNSFFAIGFYNFF